MAAGTAACVLTQASFAAPEVDAVHPDGRLFGLCDRFDELEVALEDRLSAAADDAAADHGVAALHEEQLACLGEIASHQASTIDGILRRVRTLTGWAEDLLDPSTLWDAQLVAATLRDLLALQPQQAARAYRVQA